MRLARSFWFAGIAFAAGCTAIGSSQYAERFGTPEPRERVVERLPAGDIDYWRDVRPIVENRCVVCHACYDAPCQLQMSSIEGIERGGRMAAALGDTPESSEETRQGVLDSLENLVPNAMGRMIPVVSLLKQMMPASDSA